MCLRICVSVLYFKRTSICVFFKEDIFHSIYAVYLFGKICFVFLTINLYLYLITVLSFKSCTSYLVLYNVCDNMCSLGSLNTIFWRAYVYTLCLNNWVKLCKIDTLYRSSTWHQHTRVSSEISWTLLPYLIRTQLDSYPVYGLIKI